MTCEICGTEQDQHDKRIHALAERVARLEAWQSTFTPSITPTHQWVPWHEDSKDSAAAETNIDARKVNGPQAEGPAIDAHHQATPAAAGTSPPAAGPLVPAGWRLADGWRVAGTTWVCGIVVDKDGRYYCGAVAAFSCGARGACDDHAVEMGALVRDEAAW